MAGEFKKLAEQEQIEEAALLSAANMGAPKFDRVEQRDNDLVFLDNGRVSMVIPDTTIEQLEDQLATARRRINPPGVHHEEIIFTGFDTGWGKDMPVRLINYEDGTVDIHRQSGDQFDEHIIEAKKILKARGLKIDKTDDWMWGSTGGYRAVVKR